MVISFSTLFRPLHNPSVIFFCCPDHHLSEQLLTRINITLISDVTKLKSLNSACPKLECHKCQKNNQLHTKDFKLFSIKIISPTLKL